MNKDNPKYFEFKNIIDNWQLDDWSINKECFDKIGEILEFGKIILELGSGKSSELLSKFYNVISVEDNLEWINKYNTTYIQIDTVDNGGYNFKKLEEKIKNIDYDLLIIDGPNDNREKILDNIDIFKNDIPIIWDDTQVYEKFAILMSEKINKSYTTYKCEPQAPWFWSEKCGGKSFTLIY